MTLVTCREASFAYDGHTVLSGLNFTIESGDYLCVLGENGSGKSTLIKGLLRLKAPQSGTITLCGGLRPNEIGYLPQRAETPKDFPASCYEVVLSGRIARRGIRPFYAKADRAAARESLERMGMWEQRNRCFGELSGGQQQRVLLARALCATAKMLLLDEPVAGLDPVATQELYRQIEEINRDLGITVVMVSHDVHSAVQYAGKILHLGNESFFFGTTAEYCASDIGKRFLGGCRHD